MQITYYNILTDKTINPLTIALVADLHGKPYQKVIDSLNVVYPDVIAMVGDVINGDAASYPIGFFQCCATIAPSFFSLGNHERKITDEQIAKVNNTGVTVLDNSWVKYDDFIIGGMTSLFVTEWRETHKTVLYYVLSKTECLDEVERRNGFKILFDHHSENYERVTRARDIDLIFSGHAHGGQIRIFKHGLYEPHQGFFQKYISGVYENRLAASRGLANIKLIPRLGNPTELVYIQLKNNLRSAESAN